MTRLARPQLNTRPARCAQAVMLFALGLMFEGSVVFAAEMSEPTRDRVWGLRVPSVERVVFRGGVSAEPLGLGTGTMMYPAPSALGLLAAVMTHGVINSHRLQDQKDKAQAEDDRVLEPLAPVLTGFTNRRLWESSLPRMRSGESTRLLEPTEPVSDCWLVESAPVFSMPQDQRGLVLDNVVRIFAPGASKAVYAQTVRVVSAPLDRTDVKVADPGGSAASAAAQSDAERASAAVRWLDADGRRLLELSAALFAESLDVAFADARALLGDAAAPHKTFRYREGGREKMERAQLVDARCDRILIRTLRGALMSIPQAGLVDAATCPAAF